MPMIIFFLTSAFAFAEVTSPRNHYALIGGGGEPHREATTIFDHEVEGFGEFTSRSRGAWQTRAAFNGGHSGTEAMVDRLHGQSPNFSADSYSDMLRHYKEQISSGSIGRGDQLMIHIASHGAHRLIGQKSHSISAGGGMTNLTTGEGSRLVNLDELQEVINLANANGVKLAIIDTSCHSGSSIKLANPQTCVISSSGPDHYAAGHYIGFGARFSRELRRGRNLEDVFQRTISQRPMPTGYGTQIPPIYGFPMISTSAGSRLQDELYPLLTPYLYSRENNVGLDKLDPFMRRSVQEDPTCELPRQNFQNLIREIQELSATNRRAQTQPLITALQNYENLQRELREGLAAIQTPDLSRTEEFCRPNPPAYGPGNVCQSVKLSDLTLMDYTSAMNSTRNQLSTQTGPAREYSQMLLNLYTDMNTRAQQLKNDPELRRSREYFSRMTDLSGRTSRLSLAVYTELHKIYPALYREEARRTESAPNPCREFVL